MAVNKSVGIRDKIYAKLEQEAKKTNQKMGTLINHHLEAYYKSISEPQLFECRLCSEVKALEPNGLCPDCLDIVHNRKKQEYDNEYNKILKVIDSKKEEEEKKAKAKEDSELVTDLKEDLKRKRNILKRYEEDPDRYIESLGESEYNLRISNFKVEIREAEDKLKEIGISVEEI